MIQEIREKFLQLNNNDEFFYLIFAINQISGFLVNKNSLYYAIKNTESLKSENIKTDLLNLQTNRYINTTESESSLKSDYYNLIEFKDDINSENFDSFINLCFMHANIAEQKPLNMFFNSLINLFQIPREQQFKNIIGLYGELSFILYIYKKYGIDLTDYWHQSGSTDSYDFKLKNLYFEVKSTLKVEPVIKIKHKQIFNNFSNKIFLGIVQLQENNNGMTLSDLVSEIEKIKPKNFLYEFTINLEKEKRKISLYDYNNKKMEITDINTYKASNLKTIEKIPNNILDIEYYYNFNSLDKNFLSRKFLEENL